MRDSTIYTFKFRFRTPENDYAHLLPKEGRINLESLQLVEDAIYYQDIRSVGAYKNLLVLNLMPYPTLEGNLSEYVLPGHHSIVISVSDPAVEIKAFIDRHLSRLAIEERMAGMSKEEIRDYFRKRSCPHCGAHTDLTGLRDSTYIYCKYCQVIFNQFNHLAPGGTQYKTCPECGFFDRIRDHLDYRVYITTKGQSFKKRTRHCCDACATELSEETLVKNMTLLVGTFADLYEKYKIRTSRHPDFQWLCEANLFARKGDMSQAAELFYKILYRLPHHPGIFFNQGMGYLKAGDEEKAYEYFERSLNSCSNYLPTLEVLKKHADEA